MKKVAGKINREWHELHRMPPSATLAQRIEWHIAHAANCGCRDMPEKIKQAIKEGKLGKGVKS